MGTPIHSVHKSKTESPINNDDAALVAAIDMRGRHFFSSRTNGPTVQQVYNDNRQSVIILAVIQIKLHHDDSRWLPKENPCLWVWAVPQVGKWQAAGDSKW